MQVDLEDHIIDKNSIISNDYNTCAVKFRSYTVLLECLNCQINRIRKPVEHFPRQFSADEREPALSRNIEVFNLPKSYTFVSDLENMNRTNTANSSVGVCDASLAQMAELDSEKGDKQALGITLPRKEENCKNDSLQNEKRHKSHADESDIHIGFEQGHLNEDLPKFSTMVSRNEPENSVSATNGEQTPITPSLDKMIYAIDSLNQSKHAANDSHCGEQNETNKSYFEELFDCQSMDPFALYNGSGDKIFYSLSTQGNRDIISQHQRDQMGIRKKHSHRSKVNEYVNKASMENQASSKNTLFRDSKKYENKVRSSMTKGGFVGVKSVTNQQVVITSTPTSHRISFDANPNLASYTDVNRSFSESIDDRSKRLRHEQRVFIKSPRGSEHVIISRPSSSNKNQVFLIESPTLNASGENHHANVYSGELKKTKDHDHIPCKDEHTDRSETNAEISRSDFTQSQVTTMMNDRNHDILLPIRDITSAVVANELAVKTDTETNSHDLEHDGICRAIRQSPVDYLATVNKNPDYSTVAETMLLVNEEKQPEPYDTGENGAFEKGDRQTDKQEIRSVESGRVIKKVVPSEDAHSIENTKKPSAISGDMTTLNCEIPRSAPTSSNPLSDSLCQLIDLVTYKLRRSDTRRARSVPMDTTSDEESEVDRYTSKRKAKREQKQVYDGSGQASSKESEGIIRKERNDKSNTMKLGEFERLKWERKITRDIKNHIMMQRKVNSELKRNGGSRYRRSAAISSDAFSSANDVNTTDDERKFNRKTNIEDLAASNKVNNTRCQKKESGYRIDNRITHDDSEINVDNDPANATFSNSCIPQTLEDNDGGSPHNVKSSSEYQDQKEPGMELRETIGAFDSIGIDFKPKPNENTGNMHDNEEHETHESYVSDVCREKKNHNNYIKLAFGLQPTVYDSLDIGYSLGVYSDLHDVPTKMRRSRTRTRFHPYKIRDSCFYSGNRNVPRKISHEGSVFPQREMLFRQKNEPFYKESVSFGISRSFSTLMDSKNMATKRRPKSINEIGNRFFADNYKIAGAKVRSETSVSCCHLSSQHQIEPEAACSQGFRFPDNSNSRGNIDDADDNITTMHARGSVQHREERRSSQLSLDLDNEQQPKSAPMFDHNKTSRGYDKCENSDRVSLRRDITGQQSRDIGAMQITSHDRDHYDNSTTIEGKNSVAGYDGASSIKVVQNRQYLYYMLLLIVSIVISFSVIMYCPWSGSEILGKLNFIYNGRVKEKSSFDHFLEVFFMGKKELA